MSLPPSLLERAGAEEKERAGAEKKGVLIYII